MQTLAYGVDNPQDKFHPMHITRRNTGDHDVGIDILYCGICHSDIHTARNEWSGTKYPVVPGHEILGRITKVGSKVTKFKEGDLAGVGCFVDSCRDCDQCKTHEEQFCAQGVSFTYNGTERDKKTPTYGGYSTYVVVDQDYVYRVPEKFTNLAGVAPLLCAGITTYSPLRAHQSKVGPGKRVGIVGLGGLGHMGVKFAASMGAQVTVFSTSPSKEGDAKKLGATHFVISKDENAMKATENSFDLILDTVSATHDVIPYVKALKAHGVYAVVGAPPEPFKVASFNLIFGNKTVYGSLIGGTKETQEMIDYCAEHNIVSEVEVIKADQIEEAYERTLKSDVKYRFVIDIKSFGK
jgi:uncharacterized zinc-type alcohol dehydrogenase-like protein